MNPIKYARDTSGASVGLAHWQWGSRRTFAVGATVSRSAEPLTGHSVFIEVTTPVHLRLGGADVSAGPNDPILKPGAIYTFPRALGENHISAVTPSGAAAGTLEYWQADDFIEA